MSSNPKPFRWGIIATGSISTIFVSDLLLPNSQPTQPTHTITAIGSSTLSKAQTFTSTNLPSVSPAPTLYAGYAGVYTDPNVDIVYIGTPHALHAQNCLDAIAGGKHILCEKAFALNARDARRVFAAAREKGVFVMEAVWTRFFPLVGALTKVLHQEKRIGVVHRVFADFSQDHDLASKGMESRLKNVALGAGSALNLGVYSVTWGLLGLGVGVGEGVSVKAVQVLQEGFDVATSVMLLCGKTGGQAICTSSSLIKAPSKEFCRIEGSKGYVVVSGAYASRPESFTVYLKDGEKEGTRYDFSIPGAGFRWEADAVARDVAAGRLENELMPWAETVRVLEIMDEVRKQGGARLEGDDW